MKIGTDNIQKAAKLLEQGFEMNKYYAGYYLTQRKNLEVHRSEKCIITQYVYKEGQLVDDTEQTPPYMLILGEGRTQNVEIWCESKELARAMVEMTVDNKIRNLHNQVEMWQDLKEELWQEINMMDIAAKEKQVIAKADEMIKLGGDKEKIIMSLEIHLRKEKDKIDNQVEELSKNEKDYDFYKRVLQEINQRIDKKW